MDKKAYQKKYQPPYQHNRYIKKKKEFVQYLGSKCVECGAKTDLEFHHIDSHTKKFSILSRWKLPLEEIKPELDKCVLLCRNCHHKHTQSQRGWHNYGHKSTNAERSRVYYEKHKDEINRKKREGRCKAWSGLQNHLAGSDT